LKQKSTRQKQEKWHSQPSDALVNGYRIPSDYFKPTHLLTGQVVGSVEKNDSYNRHCSNNVHWNGKAPVFRQIFPFLP
jgi:hypothetical protein